MRIPGNFDRWMFNYKEGNLSPEEIEYFKSTLLNDPQYSEDIEAWDNAYVRNEPFEYSGAASLQKASPFKVWGRWAAVLLLLLTSASYAIWQSNKIEQKTTYSLRNSQIEFNLAKNGNLEPFQFSKMTKSNTPNAPILALRSIRTIETEMSQLNTGVKEGVDYQGDISYAYNNENVVDAEILAIEKAKIDNSSSDNSSIIKSNPKFSDKKIDSKLKRQKRKFSLKYKLIQAYNIIEKRTGYPLALVNLRDPDLLIPNKNLMSFNPAFTGSSGQFRIGADYRNQWLGKDANSESSSLYFDNYSKSLRGGVGASVNYNSYNSGAYQNIVANLFYSPKFVIGKHVVFEPAVKMSLGLLTLNTDKIVPNHAIEMDRGRVLPTFTEGDVPTANNLWYKDYGVGFVVNTDWFYVGASVDNIAMHKETVFTTHGSKDLRRPRLYNDILGFDFQSRDQKRLLSPFLSYTQFGGKKEAWVGMTAQFNWLTVGASYSSNNEYAASVGLKFKSFKLNYQFDYLESEFSQENFVSHNIGIRFNSKSKTTR